MERLSFDDAEQFREKIKRQVEEARMSNNYGQCAQINPNICGASLSYQPAYEPPKNDQEIYYRSIGEENRKLREEKQHYILQLQSLQNEIRRVKEENYNYKIKGAKKIRNFDGINKFYGNISTEFNSIYQSIYNWFNT